MAEEVVVLGGGYAGMFFVRRILGSLPAGVRVTLVDRLPKSPLKTEFYSFAAGATSLKEVTLPFPDHPQLRLVFDEVIGIDQDAQRVELRETGQVPYTVLVVALGCVDRFHGLPGAEEYALGLQTLKRTQRTGQEILTLDAYRQVLLIGAGLTGIELAAELRETRPDLNIAIIDRNDRVLNGFSDKLRGYVEQWLADHDVKVLHHVATREILKDSVETETGDIPYDKLVWTAGIQAHPLVQTLRGEFDSIGRIRVNGQFQTTADPFVRAIGDCAASEHPPTAQVAEFQGDYLGEILIATWRGQAVPVRAYSNRGTLGALGRAAGFGSVKGVDLAGKVPRFLKTGVLWNYKRHVEK